MQVHYIDETQATFLWEDVKKLRTLKKIAKEEAKKNILLPKLGK